MATEENAPDVVEVEGHEDDAPDAGAKPADAKPEPPADKAASDDLKAQALKKANREAQERRKELTEARARIAELEAANASESEKAILAARQEAAAEREAQLRPAVVRAEARAALSGAGCTDTAVQKTLMRLIDSGAVELDDDGEVVGGLAEQIGSLKEQFPEKFTVARRVPSAREVDASDKKPPVVKRSVGQQLAARVLGAGQ